MVSVITLAHRPPSTRHHLRLHVGRKPGNGAVLMFTAEALGAVIVSSFVRQHLAPASSSF